MPIQPKPGDEAAPPAIDLSEDVFTDESAVQAEPETESESESESEPEPVVIEADAIVEDEAEPVVIEAEAVVEDEPAEAAESDAAPAEPAAD
jgi:hypothetical protein